MTSFYDWLVHLPDRFYPGGQAAYERLKAADFARYGEGYYGLGLYLYFTLFHIVGSAAFAFVALMLARHLRSEPVFWLLIGALVLFITVQEAYLHPLLYGQVPAKGIVDWLAWVVPAALIAFLHVAGRI